MAIQQQLSFLHRLPFFSYFFFFAQTCKVKYRARPNYPSILHDSTQPRILRASQFNNLTHHNETRKIPSRYNTSQINPACYFPSLHNLMKQDEKKGIQKKSKEKNYAYMTLFLSIGLESKQKTCLSCFLSLSSLPSLSTNRKKFKVTQC